MLDDSDDGGDSPLFSDAGGGFNSDSDDGVAFFIDGDQKKAPIDAFGYVTPIGAADNDDYDAAYARQTREALSAMGYREGRDYVCAA